MSEEDLRDNSSEELEMTYHRKLDSDEEIIINQAYREVQLCLSNRSEVIKGIRELMDMGVEDTEELTASIASILKRISVEGRSKKLLNSDIEEMEYFFNNGEMKFTGEVFKFEDFKNNKVVYVDVKGFVIKTEDMGEGYQRNLFKQAN
jgi:hypothetical protein